MAEVSQSSTHKYKLDVEGALRDSWDTFTKHWGILLLLTLTPALAFVVVAVVMFAVMGVSLLAMADKTQPVVEPAIGVGAALFVLAVVLMAVAVSVVAYGATIKTLLQIFKTGKEPTYSEAMQSGVTVFWQVVAVSLLVAFAIVGGLILLIIPGLIFAFWFSLALQVALDQKMGAVDAMKESKRLVSSNVGLILTLWVIYFVASMVVGFLPIVGSVLGIVISMLATVTYVYVYLGLKQHGGHKAATATAGS